MTAVVNCAGALQDGPSDDLAKIDRSKLPQATPLGEPHFSGMPRYFFHTRDGDQVDLDDEGTVLPNDQAAKNAAKELLAALNRDKLPDGDQMELAVTVKNEVGAEVYSVRLNLEGN